MGEQNDSKHIAYVRVKPFSYSGIDLTHKILLGEDFQSVTFKLEAL